jgi:hypothetical protein
MVWLSHMAVKTTLNLDERLLARAKALALREGTTLTAIVEQSLRARLAPRAKTAKIGKPGQFDLPTVKGTAAPNVDVADRDALFDVLDDEP